MNSATLYNKMTKPWVEQYRPKTLSEVQGQEEAISKLKSAVLKKKPVLIYGSVGCGKTTAAYAIAHDLNYEIIEVNASDFRNADKIKATVGNSLQQMSLFAKGKIVLVDEVDGIAGNEDRGGIQELNHLLENAKHSVILTANDPWNQKLSTLRSKCEVVEFKKINISSVFNVLESICAKENIKYDEKDLKVLARKSAGDLRGAINDLQTLTESSRSLRLAHIEELSDRERKESIFNVLMVILKTKDIAAVQESMKNLDVDYDELALWLEENIPREYKEEDLKNAFEMLSMADVFKGRIMRRQHWRFLVYISTFLGVGVSLAKQERHPGFTPYRRYMRLLRRWQLNAKNSKRDAIAEKIAERLNMSKRSAIQNMMPYIRIMAKNEVMPELKLEEEEISWLGKQ